jgi:NADPH-dependent 2,4-dienoyl-CoA reductase/sulfur reductase-like enzyme
MSSTPSLRLAPSTGGTAGGSPAGEGGAGVAVVGAGPAGLMAAEMMARAGLSVTVFDRMPSPARKLLIAGRGGLNLTHSEPLPLFLSRYGEAAARLRPAVEAFHRGPWWRGARRLGSRPSWAPAAGCSPAR